MRCRQSSSTSDGVSAEVESRFLDSVDVETEKDEDAAAALPSRSLDGDEGANNLEANK